MWNIPEDKLCSRTPPNPAALKKIRCSGGIDSEQEKKKVKIDAAVGHRYYLLSGIANETTVVLETESCPICYSDFEHEESKSHSKFETVKMTLQCGHQVHLQYLLRWFSIQNSGGRRPVCSTKVPTEPSPSTSSMLPLVQTRSL